jgi:hypothetical protein
MISDAIESTGEWRKDLRHIRSLSDWVIKHGRHKWRQSKNRNRQHDLWQI